MADWKLIAGAFGPVVVMTVPGEAGLLAKGSIVRLLLPLKKIAVAPFVVTEIVPGGTWFGSKVSEVPLKSIAIWPGGGLKLVWPVTSQGPLLNLCVVVIVPLHVPDAHVFCAAAAVEIAASSPAEPVQLNIDRSAVEARHASL